MKLLYKCPNCSFEIKAPEGKRGCPKCNILLVAGEKVKENPKEETKPLANKRFIKKRKSRKKK